MNCVVQWPNQIDRVTQSEMIKASLTAFQWINLFLFKRQSLKMQSIWSTIHFFCKFNNKFQLWINEQWIMKKPSKNHGQLRSAELVWAVSYSWYSIAGNWNEVLICWMHFSGFRQCQSWFRIIDIRNCTIVSISMYNYTCNVNGIMVTLYALHLIIKCAYIVNWP